MGPKPGTCVVCGETDADQDHRDEDNYIARCPFAVSITMTAIEPVRLRVVS